MQVVYLASKVTLFAILVDGASYHMGILPLCSIHIGISNFKIKRAF